MRTLGLLLDAARLFRMVSYVNEDALLLTRLVPVGTGQFKDTSESHGNVLKIPCGSHCTFIQKFHPPPPSSQTGFVQMSSGISYTEEEWR